MDHANGPRLTVRMAYRENCPLGRVDNGRRDRRQRRVGQAPYGATQGTGKAQEVVRIGELFAVLPPPDALTVAPHLRAHVRQRKAQVTTASGDAVAEVCGPDFARNGWLHAPTSRSSVVAPPHSGHSTGNHSHAGNDVTNRLRHTSHANTAARYPAGHSQPNSAQDRQRTTRPRRIRCAAESRRRCCPTHRPRGRYR